METKSKPVRAFIAIELPPAIVAEVEKIQDSLRSALPAGVLRWARPGSMHLTLKFLGNIAAQDVADVAAAMRRAGEGSTPFRLELNKLGCFPHSRQPRVVWVGVDGELEKLHLLQSRIESEVQPWVERPEDKPFRPHLTLARVATQDRRAASAVGAAVEVARPGVLGCWTVTRVVLMQSELAAHGSTYTQLAVAELAVELGAR
ncbi:MAG TPA: RNA 2',3'-cyclic phosphodiesterase [Abditibacteriaceae bacterium]|nr:RNA 2',3'-cyclic phosphodiesterase [Abditibacteriaceae bacterium]